jgi:hypothetical protein
MFLSSSTDVDYIYHVPVSQTTPDNGVVLKSILACEARRIDMYSRPRVHINELDLSRLIIFLAGTCVGLLA